MLIKSPEAFRTISEVSKDLAIPQHVLRFWETKFMQIKPIKRGGGRRYYRPEDVQLLKGIKNLLYSHNNNRCVCFLTFTKKAKVVSITTITDIGRILRIIGRECLKNTWSVCILTV